MSSVKREDIMQAAEERKQRIRGYMTQERPVPFRRIAEIEGLNDRSLRHLVREIEAELGINYGALQLRVPRDEMPYGMTNATLRFRQKLGDALYLLLERGNDSTKIGRNTAAPRVGLNNRQQMRAEQRPFNHDWTISQMERLARELNRDPREFILSCLTG